MKTKNNIENLIKKALEESLSKGDSPIVEATLSKAQLDKREDIIKDLKKNKKELVKRYGKDAEAVMYGRATNLAKKAVSEMNKEKLKELVRKSLMNENKEFTEEEIQNVMDVFNMTKEEAIDHLQQSYSDYKQFDMGEGKKTDMDGDGDIDSKDYLAKRDAAIQKAKGGMKENMSQYKVGDKIKWSSPKGEVEDEIAGIDGIYLKLKSGGSIPYQSVVSEDIDLGHEDNEPHMIKGELYQIGKYAMKLYAVLEELEETGEEIDFPAWWQSKITTAKNMMSGARHYLDFELKEPYIDAAVDAATGEAPHMGEPEPPMMEAEIGKDEILAGKIMKALKDMANKDASDQNNLKQARTALNKGNMSAAEKIAKPYLSEKIAKKLTKDELKEMIKNSINEDDIDEGFFDRLKSNIKGITAKTSTTFDNLKAFAKGDKEAVKNPKLAQNMAKLQQKAKTLDSELASVMKDMSILFPEDVISQTPEEFQTILSQYTGMLDAVKNLNTKISKAGYSRFFFVFLFQTYLFTFVKNIIKMLGSILLGFLGGLGGSEVILIVAIILLMFGGRKIPELMKGLGKGIREFKDASKGIEEKKDVQN